MRLTQPEGKIIIDIHINDHAWGFCWNNAIQCWWCFLLFFFFFNTICGRFQTCSCTDQILILLSLTNWFVSHSYISRSPATETTGQIIGLLHGRLGGVIGQWSWYVGGSGRQRVHATRAVETICTPERGKDKLPMQQWVLLIDLTGIICRLDCWKLYQHAVFLQINLTCSSWVWPLQMACSPGSWDSNVSPPYDQGQKHTCQFNCLSLIEVIPYNYFIFACS